MCSEFLAKKKINNNLHQFKLKIDLNTNLE